MSTTVVSGLSRCVALRSRHDDKSYLRCVYDETHGGSVIELCGGDGDGGIMNPRCRFYLEPSEKHERLMHIRCCYNNKYWVPQQRLLHGRGGGRWVVGTADEPEEDLSKPSCTLHRHILNRAGHEEEEEGGGGGYICRFVHSQLGKYTCASPSSSMRPYLHVAHEEADEARQGNSLIDGFILIDVSNNKQLPKYVAFKGDDGNFLTATSIEGHNYLQFSKWSDISDPRVLHTAVYNQDGFVRIKSNFFGLFWTVYFDFFWDWIRADSDEVTSISDQFTHFRVIHGDDFVALRLRPCILVEYYNFCMRRGDRLSAFAMSIAPPTRLQCHEPVISRQIYDVDFHLSEARIYTKAIEDLKTQTAENSTSTTNKMAMVFKYKHTATSIWTATVSLKIGVKTTFVSRVPFVFEGKIEASAEFSGSYQWGGTEGEEKETSQQFDVEVPPMKRVTVKALGSNGACDIPYSYTQRDLLYNGEEVVQKFSDGMYLGVKTSSITFQTTEEDL